jgi:asparagine synthase (glutamine-hydrolysing)
MCGIAGFVKVGQNVSADPAIVRQMCDVIRHRGPDDQGIYTDGGVGLGMRRLSIVDLATGHQPISNEDGSVVVVFNGEIYNHQILRAQLIARGHIYRTQSDTESIVHAYEEYGRECVNHLRGMFAFALWDARKKTLFIARDRLGIKPLYYQLTPELFLFGSEIKALLAYPGVRPELNRAVLPEYLAFGYLSGEETFYSGIRKLMPGHWLELSEDGELKIEQYWDLPLPSDETAHDESYYTGRYRDLLEGAVNSHLMSDVPLGVFLSGGVDSSVVAALMTKIRREPIETFSVGYAEQTYSELPYARMVSRHLQSIHQEVSVSEKDFFAALPKLIWHEDEPIVWPSSVALYFVARLARERVTVVLTGEGSDETLAGYTRYAFTLKNARLDTAYRALVPRLFRQQVRSSISSSKLIGAGLRRKIEHTFVGKDGENWTAFYFDNFFSAFSSPAQTELLTEEVSRQFESGAAYRNVLKYWGQSAGRAMLERLLYTDIKTYLVELLMKQDNMSMAASIESRVPFLDHVVVEFAAHIPEKVQLKGLTGKTVLKKAVKDLLPHEILYRPKLGFPTPWSGWLKGPRLDDIERMLLEPRSMNRGLFRREAVKRLFEEHRSNYRDHYDRIWRLLNLELWFRVCIEGENHELWDSAEAVNGLAVRA